MHRNSSADQAGRIKVLLSPARRGASLKCYCPFLHLFYDYFASVTCCVTERARAHYCGAFPSLLKSARDRSSVWQIRFDWAEAAVDRVERRVVWSACFSLGLPRGRSRSCCVSLSRPAVYSYRGVPHQRIREVVRLADGDVDLWIARSIKTTRLGRNAIVTRTSD